MGLITTALDKLLLAHLSDITRSWGQAGQGADRSEAVASHRAGSMHGLRARFKSSSTAVEDFNRFGI